MKTQYKILSLTLSLIAVTFLTSCGTKKSDPATQSSNRFDVNAQKTLASCNRASDSNLSFNIATVNDNNGQVNPSWIKIKFQFLSADITQTGYTLKFFKWRVIGGSAQLDSNPLQFAAYSLANGQTNSDTMNSVFATQINSQNGFYINLNDDPDYPYQVLKVVVYKTDGTIAAQTNALIPQFAASPSDYQYNNDGSARADILRSLHPLNSTDIGAWTQEQLKQNFQQYCF